MFRQPVIGPGALGILAKVTDNQEPAAKSQRRTEGKYRNAGGLCPGGISAVLSLFLIDHGKQPAADHSQRQKPAIQEDEIIIPGLRNRLIWIERRNRVGKC